MSNKLQQNLFYRAIHKVDELNIILKVPKNPIGATCLNLSNLPQGYHVLKMKKN